MGGFLGQTVSEYAQTPQGKQTQTVIGVLGADMEEESCRAVTEELVLGMINVYSGSACPAFPWPPL